MAFSMPGRGASGPQINVTPLIDVLLTLIIMFMLVVSMDPEYGEKAQIPQPNQTETPAVPQPRTVVIEVVWMAKDQPPQQSKSIRKMFRGRIWNHGSRGSISRVWKRWPLCVGMLTLTSSMWPM